MSDFKGTPGPWEMVRLSGVCGPYAIRMPYNGDKTFYGVREIAREVDAQAISAIPELIATLSELAQWYEENVGLPACSARAAIAKALGEQS
ncbi:hypothetical protein [Sphingobium abikonense]|uniref:hypothetical protein n=1 Tax=Sphingobium abikonense TaxID=86193 RepID=UPI003511D3D6